MAVVVVSGRLPPAARRRAAPAMAIASETGALVETEEERAREVQSWKTNLLRQRRPDPNARVLDPRVIPRQYSKEELSALAVPAQRIATHHLPPLPSFKADAGTIAVEAAPSTVASVVVKGMEEALELESQLLDKMSLTMGEEGGAGTYKPLASIASSVSIAMGGLGGVANEPHPFTPLALNLATPAISPVPIKDALEMMTELADAAARARARGGAPISPSERQAKLRRYKTGLSPMQKVKNMLDDIVGRIHSADKGKRPAAPLPLAEELRRRRRGKGGGGGGGGGGAAAVAAEHVETTAGKSESGKKQEHVIRIAAPQSKVAAGDVTDSLTQGAGAEQDEQNEDEALLYGGGKLEDEEVLSMQDSNLSFSLTYASDPLDALSPGAAIWASPEGLGDDDPRSIFSADGTLKDSAFQESVLLSPMSPRFVHAAQITKNKVEIVKLSRGDSRAKRSKFPAVIKTPPVPNEDEATTLDFGIKCNKCTSGGRLWCAGCKLAFCFKCWGLVDHHKPVDSVRVMNEERLVRAAAAGIVPEADAESELDDTSDAKGKDGKSAKATFKVYTEARLFKLPPKPASEEVKMAPAPLSFDERNASHFAAEKKDPERAALLQHLKVKRLAETSERMKNHYAFVRSRSHKVVKMAEQRREDVHERLDHKTRMKAIEQQMIRELEQESMASQGIGGVVLGKPSEKQIVAESFRGRSKSRSRSPDWRRRDWRSQRIASPDERLRQREEEIKALHDDPVDGWGWSAMPAKSAKNENFAPLPFSEPLKDLTFLVPDHLRDQLSSQPTPSSSASARGRGRGAKNLTSAQARVEKIVSLW